MRLLIVEDSAPLAEAVARKGNIIQFWNNENEAQGAFRVNGAAVGQTWDSTAAALAKEGLPVGFIAPKEGALAWMEGLSIPAGAENLDAAYAFINWFLTPEAGAMYTNATSINSTAVGSADLLSDQAKAFFAAAYPGDALDKLCLWLVGRVQIHGLIRDHNGIFVVDARVNDAVANGLHNHILGILFRLEVHLARNVG